MIVAMATLASVVALDASAGEPVGKTLDAARVKTWAGVEFKTPGISATQMKGWCKAHGQIRLAGHATLRD